MKLKQLIWSILMLTILASCADDAFSDMTVENEQCGKFSVNVKVEPFAVSQDAETRACFDNIEHEKEFPFTFEAYYDGDDEENMEYLGGDQFGICSLTQPSLNIPLEVFSSFNSDENQDFNLTIEVSKVLEAGSRYVVYFPYDPNFVSQTSDLCLSYSRQGQENVNDNSDLACSHNYYISDPFVYDGEAISNLSLHPLNAVLRLKLKLDAGTYKKIELVNKDSLKSFCLPSYCVLTSDGLDVIKPSDLTKKMSLSLNLSDIKVTKQKNGQKKTSEFYMAAYPTRTGDFYVKAIDTDDNVWYSKETFNLDLKAGYGYVIQCNNMTRNEPKAVETENSISYVDLGTSVYWAPFNVGAVSVAEAGNLYAWGEIITKDDYVYNDFYNYKYDSNPYSSTNPRYYSYNSFYMNSSNKKTEFTWEQYKWNRDGDFVKYGSKYRLPVGDNDESKTLQENDDVAQYVFGGKWRVPSMKEMKELRNMCYWETTDNYKGSGVAGCVVYKAKCPADKGKFYNHNASRGVSPSETYNVNNDVHIFLPFNDREGQGHNTGKYMTNATTWYSHEVGELNTWYRMFWISDYVGNSNSTSINDNVWTDVKIHVYEPTLVRPVFDKKK